MNFNLQIEGDEYVVKFSDGEDSYEGRGSSYEEAADEVEAQMLADNGEEE